MRRVTHSSRGLPIRLRTWVRARGSLHAAGRRRRPGHQRRRCPRAGASLPRRRGRRGGLPRADPVRLRDRRPGDAGRASRRRAGGRQHRGRGVAPPAAGSRRRCAAAGGQPALQLRGRGPPGRDPGRGHQVLPADLPRVLRAPVVRPGRRPARRPGRFQWEGDAVRQQPDLPGKRRAGLAPVRGDLRGHVGPGAAERRGGAGRGDRARQPLRQPDHGSPGGGPPAAGPLRERALHRGVRLRRGRAGRVHDRPVLGRSDDGLRARRAARRDRAVSRRAAPHGGRRRPRPDPAGPAAEGHVRRQPSGGGHRPGRLPRPRLHPRPAHGRHRAAPQGRPLPVRARRRRAARPGLLRGLQHPGLRAGAAALAPSASRRS